MVEKRTSISPYPLLGGPYTTNIHKGAAHFFSCEKSKGINPCGSNTTSDKWTRQRVMQHTRYIFVYIIKKN